MERRLPLAWLLSLTAVSSVKVTVTNPSVHVTRGGTALLPCTFRTSAALNRLNIIWTVTPLEEPKHPLQVIAFERGQIVESLSEYLGRVRFAFRPSHDASIFITHTRVTDTGTYQCTVINPPDGATPNIGLIGLSVLVPPSIPECSSDGGGQEGGNIHLICSVTEGIPTPHFTWQKIPPDGQLLITRQEDHRGSVTLRNLTLGTSGVYRCTATNQLGSESCTIELRIHGGGIGALGIFAAITITLIMALVLLALFALVLFLHQQSRGKGREPELYDSSRVDNVSVGQVDIMKSDSSDTDIFGLVAPPMSRPHIAPSSTHILYSIQQSQISLSPVLEIPHIREPPDHMSSDSEDEDNTSPVPPPVYRSSLYSVNSGFLV